MEKFKELEKSLQEELKRTGTRIVKGNFVTYRNICYKGYLGDFATEWWTEKDWEEHRKYIETLKADGTYGEPWICDITISHDTMYDEPMHGKSKMVESYKYDIIDLSNGGK